MSKKKVKSRPLFNVFISLLSLVLGFIIAYLFLNSLATIDINFYVLDPVKQVSINEAYVQDEIVCEIKGIDYSRDVVYEYYHNNLVVDSIDTSVKTTYVVKYILNNEKYHLSTSQIIEIVEYEDLEINFLMTGNKYAGDCIYIKAGDTDIVIDAGSKKGSFAASIDNYLKGTDGSSHEYITDGVIEYVIATHADQDHIAAFPDGIFANYEVETIIDFPLTNKTTNIYNEYRTKVNELVANGTKHYTALECYNNQNGAQRVYEVALGIEMEILYNYYYENKSSDENNYSVCVLFTRGDDKFLLTGDLEGEGEEKLVEFYQNSETLKDVYLFKAGHHGSYSSTTLPLLNLISPEVVVATCVAFTTEYTDNMDNTFPSKKAIENMVNANVEHFYVTAMVSNNSEGYEAANGHISVYADSSGKGVRCSNSNADFYDTSIFPIFGEYRSWN